MKRLKPIRAELLGSVFSINSEMYNVLEALDHSDNACEFLNILTGEDIEQFVLSAMDEYTVEEIDAESAKFVNTICKELFGEVEPSNKEQLIGLEQDQGYIKAAFIQAYSINLDVDDLDFRLFTNLLGSVTNTQLNNIIDIRSKPYEKGKGMEEYNQKLREAKEAVALIDPSKKAKADADKELLDNLFERR